MSESPRRKLKHKTNHHPMPSGGSRSSSANSNRRQNDDDTKENAKPSQRVYKYARENKHDTRNHGQRWTKDDLELMWSLWKKGYDYNQLARHFQRTECGIHVQIQYRITAENERKGVREERKQTRKLIRDLRGLASDEESSDDDVPIAKKLSKSNIKKENQNHRSPQYQTPPRAEQEFSIPSPSPYVF